MRFPAPSASSIPVRDPSSASALGEDSRLPRRGRSARLREAASPHRPRSSSHARCPRSAPAAFPHGQGSPAAPSTGSRGARSPPPRERRPRLRWLFEGAISVLAPERFPARASEQAATCHRPAALRPSLAGPRFRPRRSRADEPRRYRLRSPRLPSPQAEAGATFTAVPGHPRTSFQAKRGVPGTGTGAQPEFGNRLQPHA